MRSFIYIYLFILFLSTFFSCSNLISENLSHGMNGVVRSEKTNSDWNKILIYFEGENIIGRNYKDVAFLRIQGSELNSKKEVIEKFKKEASHFRADAVLNVSVEYIEKEKSTTLLDILGEDECDTSSYENVKYKVYEIIGTAIIFAPKEI